jgi:hypothetical protein
MLKLTVHGVKENGTCSFTGKDSEVLVVSTEDGFLSEAPVSLKGLMQLAKMKLGQNGKKAKVPEAAAANGTE